VGKDEDRLNITIGKPEVVGIDPDEPELVQVRVRLEPEPNDEWLQAFVEGPPGVSYSESMHPPRMVGHDEVMLRAPDSELERYVASLREHVEGTNAYYNSEIAPELKRRREAQKAADAEEQRRLDEARRRLDAL
jgi:hypothetical protein